MPGSAGGVIVLLRAASVMLWAGAAALYLASFPVASMRPLARSGACAVAVVAGIVLWSVSEILAWTRRR